MPHNKVFLPIMAAALLLAGCTHIKGVVFMQPGDRPHPTAVVALGRPGGISYVEEHPVNKKGEFDLWVPATDENAVFVFDSRNPDATAERIEPQEFSEHMKINLRPPAADPFPSLTP